MRGWILALAVVLALISASSCFFAPKIESVISDEDYYTSYYDTSFTKSHDAVAQIFYDSLTTEYRLDLSISKKILSQINKINVYKTYYTYNPNYFSLTKVSGCVFIGSLGLATIPLLAYGYNYYAKDDNSLLHINKNNMLYPLYASLGTFLTSELIYLPFWLNYSRTTKKAKGDEEQVYFYDKNENILPFSDKEIAINIADKRINSRTDSTGKVEYKFKDFRELKGMAEISLFVDSAEMKIKTILDESSKEQIKKTIKANEKYIIDSLKNKPVKNKYVIMLREHEHNAGERTIISRYDYEGNFVNKEQLPTSVIANNELWKENYSFYGLNYWVVFEDNWGRIDCGEFYLDLNKGGIVSKKISLKEVIDSDLIYLDSIYGIKYNYLKNYDLGRKEKETISNDLRNKIIKNIKKYGEVLFLGEFYEGLATFCIRTEEKNIKNAEFYIDSVTNSIGYGYMFVGQEKKYVFYSARNNSYNEVGVWGFVDKQGNVIIPPEYYAVSDFFNGIAAVSGREYIDEKSWHDYHAIINHNGKIVLNGYHDTNGEMLWPIPGWRSVNENDE